MENCLFCNIINKTEEAYVLYENDDVIVFLDKFPKEDHPGHTLVVPKKHQRLIYENDFDFNIINEVNKTARLLIDKLKCDGIKVANNNERIADQVVDHVHIHVIPYYKDCSHLQSKSLEEILNIIKG